MLPEPERCDRVPSRFDMPILPGDCDRGFRVSDASDRGVWSGGDMSDVEWDSFGWYGEMGCGAMARFVSRGARSTSDDPNMDDIDILLLGRGCGGAGGTGSRTAFGV